MSQLKTASIANSNSRCSSCALHQWKLCGAFANQNGAGHKALHSAHIHMLHIDAGDVIYSQGDATQFVYSLVSGWVCLHQDTPDGRRHIGKFLLPGALFGLEPKGIAAGQGATSLTAATVCALPRARFEEMRQHDTAFNERFLWMLERESHMAVEGLTVMCQGSAMERVSYILWDLAIRLCESDVVPANVPLAVPLTQRIIAEATGLTAIHVNRIIRRLRLEHLVELNDGAMLIRNPKRFSQLALFNEDSRQLWQAEWRSVSGSPRGNPSRVA